MEVLVLFLLVIFTFHGKTGSVSTGGREFLVTFQENALTAKNGPKDQCITLTTSLDIEVSVEVKSLYPDNNFSTHVIITNTTGENICFDNSMKLQGTGVSRKVVKVKSQENINVLVHDFESRSVDTYLAIPVEDLGTQYYVISYWHQSQFSVTASHNDTEITIEFPTRVNPSLNYEVQYDAVTYVNPTDMNLLLQEHEVFQLQMMQDLTGVFVSSNKAIAVISGNRKISTGLDDSADHTVEQLPPVDTWGRHFISVPSPGKVEFDIYRILTSGPDTIIYIGNDTYSLEKEGDWFEVEIAAVPVEIKADTAILVVKLVTLFGTEDPCMMLIVPVKQWHYEYSFRFPKGNGYLLVVIETVSRTRLLLNSEPLIMDKWMEAEDRKISVGYKNLSLDYYTLRSASTDVVFAAYVHQYIRTLSYCSPVGMKFEKINSNLNHTRFNRELCESTSTSTAATETTEAVTTTPTVTVITTTDLASDDPATSPVATADITTDTISTTYKISTDDMSSTAHESKTGSTWTDKLNGFISTVDLAILCNIAGTTSMTSAKDKTSIDSTTTGRLEGSTEEAKTTGTNANCSCQDDGIRIFSNMSDDEIRKIITNLKFHLKIIPNQTSRAIRMKTSVPDYRPSAMAFAITGWSVVFITITIVCLNDIPYLFRHFRQGTRRPKRV